MKTLIASILYFLIGILYIVLRPSLTFYPELLLKSLIIPALLIIFILNLNRIKSFLSVLMISGLIFSWAGDIAIELSFIAGLSSFLAAHLMYLSAFFFTSGENVIFSSHRYFLIPVIAYGAIFILFLYSDLEGMRLPVIFYTIVILTMLASAINRINKVNRTSYWLVLMGAALFVLSDSVIALNRFSFPFQSSGWIIMASYITAQYFIITGYIRQYSRKMV